ncbi:MAG: dihydrofolate reductase [Xanthomonadales bacterium]|nr:dihydrofolate reductase [Xanthomonadales bacterium]
MTELVLIAALDCNRAIGRGNAMPWHLPNDLRRFRKLTMGHPVLMGRRTAQSIGKALPGRENLVLTRHGQAPWPGQQVVASLEQALMRTAAAPQLHVIGGGEVYAATLAQAQRLHLTWVDTEVADADTWFPALDVGQWQETASQAHRADERHAWDYRFVDYRRVAD